MYKLPQLPHDQLQAFICELFNQLMALSGARDFEIKDGLIQSEHYGLVILVVPLPIEMPTAEALKELEKQTSALLKRNNDFVSKKKPLVVATNYALDIPFQKYLDADNSGDGTGNDDSSSRDLIYIDWQAISLLADNPFPEFNLSNFYPDLNFQKLPYNFKDGKEEIDYYREGVYRISKIFRKESLQSAVYRIRLARAFDKQNLFLEALKEHKVNADFLKKILAKGQINDLIANLYWLSSNNIGNAYYKLGDYATGVKWHEDAFLTIGNFYEEKHNYRYLGIVVGLLSGYLYLHLLDKASKVFEDIEPVLENKKRETSIIRQYDLYLLGTTLYDSKGDENKALQCFLESWNILENDTNARIIKGHTGTDKSFLQSTYTKYYTKLINSQHLILNYSSLNYLESKTKKNLPFAIKQIEIRNYHCIKNISIESIPVDAQWIFITGKNGTGKSSLLQAIAIGLIGDAIQKYFILPTKQETILSIELLQDKEDQIHTFSVEKEQWKSSKKNPSSIVHLPVLGYGVSRLGIQSEDTEREKAREDDAFSLFELHKGNLDNIQKWLKDEKLKHNKITEQMKMVIDTLCQLMPSVTKIKINGSQVEYTENGVVVTMEKLASGNKSILAMVGDMLIRLLRFFPKTKKTSNFKGIILIDELDLHLHPYWQRELPWRLSEIFPNVQFICTTHSIIPFMGAPKRSVFFTLERTEEKWTTIKRLDLDVSNFSADILLTSPLFDVSLFSKFAESEGNTQGYRTESDYESYFKKLEDNEEFKALQEKYGNVFGDNLFKK